MIKPSTWNEWDILTKTEQSYEWAPLSWGKIWWTLSNQTDLQTALNAKQNTLTASTWISISNDTITNTAPFTPWIWTTWQLLTKTSEWYSWEDAPEPWFAIAPDSPLKPKYLWYWTQSQYDALTQYYTVTENDTVYFTIDW